MKMNSVIIVFLLLLIGCQDTSKEELGSENLQDPDSEIIENEDIEEDMNALNEQEKGQESTVRDTTHEYRSFVHENTFTDPYALQAWEDYQAVVSQLKYGNLEKLRDGDPNAEDSPGASINEVDTLFTSLNIREDVLIEKMEVNNQEEIHFYRYPAKAGSELSEISDFLVELTFYYMDDQLIFSSITPGLYELKLENLPSVETLTSLLKVREIEDLDPQVFTIAEMELEDKRIQQLMIPATALTEDGTEAIAAFYYFTHGEDILYYAFLPFELVSQSFPDNSLLIYNEILPELSEVSF